METDTAEDSAPSRHSTIYGGNGISRQGADDGFPLETNEECIKSSRVAPHSQHAQNKLQTKDNNIKPETDQR